MTKMSGFVMRKRGGNAPSQLAARLRATRKHLGLSQKAMAKKVGIDPKTWQRTELGKGEPRMETVRQLIRLGFNANWIIDGIGDMQIDGAQSTSPNLTESDLRNIGFVYGIGPYAPQSSSVPRKKPSRLFGRLLSLVGLREARP